MTLHNMIIDCKCLILDSENRILLVQEPEHWETPGGRLEENETPLQCIVREIREEICARVNITDRLPLFFRETTTQQRHETDVLAIYFFGQLLTKPKPNTNRTQKEKILRTGWFSLQDIKNITLNKPEQTRLIKIVREIPL